MSEQYFTPAPASKSAPRAFQTEIFGRALTFSTDAGVFSRDEVDAGTRLLIEALPPLSGRVLDLGCGWGAVGVAVGAEYPQTEIVMCDINARACALAEGNLRANGVMNARVACCDAFDGVEGQFDVIITNPPIRAGKQVIYAMFDMAKTRLTPGGRLYIVIRKQQGAQSALRHLKEVYGNAELISRDKGYWVIVSERMDEK